MQKAKQLNYRALLESVADYVEARSNAREYPDLISEDEAESTLSAIASRFEQIVAPGRDA